MIEWAVRRATGGQAANRAEDGQQVSSSGRHGQKPIQHAVGRVPRVAMGKQASDACDGTCRSSQEPACIAGQEKQPTCGMCRQAGRRAGKRAGAQARHLWDMLVPGWHQHGAAIHIVPVKLLGQLLHGLLGRRLVVEIQLLRRQVDGSPPLLAARNRGSGRRRRKQQEKRRGSLPPRRHSDRRAWSSRRGFKSGPSSSWCRCFQRDHPDVPATVRAAHDICSLCS